MHLLNGSYTSGDTHIHYCIMYPSIFKGKEPANPKVTNMTASLRSPGGADDRSADTPRAPLGGVYDKFRTF